MNVDSAIQSTLASLVHYLGPGWMVRLNNDTKRAGCITPNLKLLTLSAPIIRANPPATVRAVVHHEIAHALAPTLNHDRWWKDIARRIGGDQAAMAKVKVVLPPGKYRYQCPGCGTRTERSRKVKKGCVLVCAVCPGGVKLLTPGSERS